MRLSYMTKAGSRRQQEADEEHLEMEAKEGGAAAGVHRLLMKLMFLAAGRELRGCFSPAWAPFAVTSLLVASCKLPVACYQFL